jgi:hypothetical protein
MKKFVILDTDVDFASFHRTRAEAAREFSMLIASPDRNQNITAIEIDIPRRGMPKIKIIGARVNGYVAGERGHREF